LFLTLIIGLIVPAFQIPTPSKKIVCLSNLHCLGVGFQIYHQKNKIWIDKENWCDLIKPYTDEDRKPWLCPADKIGPCSYAMNENIPADVNNLPPDLVLLFESAPGWNRTGGPNDVVNNRHDKNTPGANIALADGHVEFVPVDKIPSLRWTIKPQIPAGTSK
jgi:prepilin-type processing-associated H-X9-DG protein